MSTLIITLLAHLAQLFGGNLGWAILTLSLGIRLALLPFTLRISRRIMRNQQIALTLQPEIEELKKQFENKPERFFNELQKVYKKHGYRPFDAPAILGSLLQLPIFAFLYRAIRDSLGRADAFLWIKSLASSDALLTAVVVLLAGASVYFMPSASETAKTAIVCIQIAFTGFLVWKLAAGLGLYWVAANLVSLFQALWLRYRNPKNAWA